MGNTVSMGTGTDDIEDNSDQKGGLVDSSHTTKNGIINRGEEEEDLQNKNEKNNKKKSKFYKKGKLNFGINIKKDEKVQNLLG